MYESTNIHKVFSTKLQGNVHLLLVDVKQPRCCVVLGYACAGRVLRLYLHTLFTQYSLPQKRSNFCVW